MITDHDGCHGGKVLLVEVRDLDVPALLARLRVERDEVVVGCLEEQVVVPQRRAAVADVCAALGLPEVLPEQSAVACVHRPHVVGRGDVQDAVDLQDGALDAGAEAAPTELAGAFPSDVRRGRGTAAAPTEPAAAKSSAAGARIRRPRIHARDPGERQAPDVARVDFLERAVSPPRVVAGVRRPRVGQWLGERGRIESARR